MFKIGDRVKTRRDGVGTIIRSNGGDGWVIQFDRDGINIAFDWELYRADE